MGAFVGIDPESDGLKRAERLGVPITAKGIDGLVALPGFADIAIVFDATSAGAHKHDSDPARATASVIIDLTPAAIGPYTIPPVNGAANLDAPNVNMVTCGGQATIPIVAAVNRVSPVHLRRDRRLDRLASPPGPAPAPISTSSPKPRRRRSRRSAARRRGKAIIVLNPAEPPLIMRDTVYCLVCDDADTAAIEASVEAMVAEVQAYVPGYGLKQKVQFERIGNNDPLRPRNGR
jgi:acetaldehyde dehydrogenase